MRKNLWTCEKNVPTRHNTKKYTRKAHNFFMKQFLLSFRSKILLLFKGEDGEIEKNVYRTKKLFYTLFFFIFLLYYSFHSLPLLLHQQQFFLYVISTTEKINDKTSRHTRRLSEKERKKLNGLRRISWKATETVSLGM